MSIQFIVRFHTVPGQSIWIRFFMGKKASYSTDYEFPLHFLDEHAWLGQFNPSDFGIKNTFKYACVLKAEGKDDALLTKVRKVKSPRDGWGGMEIIEEGFSSENYEKVFATKPFKKVFTVVSKKNKKSKSGHPTHFFRAITPVLGRNKLICITGSAKSMGEWDQASPFLLQHKKEEWIAQLNLSDETYPIEYKYGIFDTSKGIVIDYEEGNNRVLERAAADKGHSVFFQIPRIQKHYWKGAGINVPLTALRSENDWGSGDFHDLGLFTRFVSKAGFRMIQLLPIQDTTATHTRKDSYPYAGISVFAIHPVFLDIKKMAVSSGIEFSKELLDRVYDINKQERLDFNEAVDLKVEAARIIYEQEKFAFKDDFAFFEFFDLNRQWLIPYSAFCFLRDKYGTVDFSAWNEYALYDEEKVQQLVDPTLSHYDEIAFHYFIQYHLHLQLLDVVEEAHKQKVILKGDLPIGVGRFSADTWQFPHIFHLDMQSGAPPDAFSRTGQNWGFPTYNWEEMEREGFSWWRRRMEHLSQYFDALRIDHVLGFFRIWSIPVEEKEGINGRFVPALPVGINDFERMGIEPDETLLIHEEKNTSYDFRINMKELPSYSIYPETIKERLSSLYHHYFFEKQDELWQNEGQKKLALLQRSSDMLLCAEDLGMVPPVVHEVLTDLQILRLQVQRMPVESESQFSKPADAPYLSVVTPGTHDTSSLRGWWEEDRNKTQYYYNHFLGHYGAAPEHCEPWICSEIIARHLASPAMWSVFLLQDLLSIEPLFRMPDPSDERINDPSNPDHFWDYRVPVSLEMMIEEKIFMEKLKQMIRDNDRY